MMLAAGLAPIVVAVSALGICAARNIPTTDVLRPGRDAQDLGCIGIHVSQARSHTLRIDDLVGACRAVDLGFARIIGVGGINGCDDGIEAALVVTHALYSSA